MASVDLVVTFAGPPVKRESEMDEICKINQQLSRYGFNLSSKAERNKVRPVWNGIAGASTRRM